MQNDFGKMFFIVQLFILSCVGANQLEIALFQLNGEPLEQITKSHPFIFQVSTDVSESFNVPALDLPGQARSQLVSTNIITKNGKARARYQFQVHIDTLGTYRIGPATLQTGRGEIVSDSIFVEVVDPSTASSSRAHVLPSQKQSGPFVRLLVDKTDYFVGERVDAAVRFYYKESFLECESLREPAYDKMSGIKLIDKGRTPISGTEKIDGITYKFYEWSFNFTASIPGQVTLNPYRIDYSIGTTPSIFDLIGINSRVSKSTYSNEAHIQVHKLPSSSIKTDMVGEFTSFVARLSPAVVHQGQAATLRLELVGDLIDIQDIALQGIDSALKVYPSVKTLEKRSSKVAHIFEYVLQPKALGDYTIPAQQFTFFDPNARKYQTLSTDELSVSVIESSSSSSSIKSGDKDIPVVDDVQKNSIVLYDKEHVRQMSPFGQRWFFMIMTILIILALLLTALAKQLYSFLIVRRAYGRLQARRWVAQEIKNVYKQKQYTRLHAIMHEYAVRISDLYDVKAENLLKKAGMHVPNKARDAYQVFIEKLERATFSRTSTEDALQQSDVMCWLSAIDRGVRRESK